MEGPLEREDHWKIFVYENGHIESTFVVSARSTARRHLIDWAKANADEWGFTPVTYVPDLLIMGSSFQLNIRKTDAVFGSAGHFQYLKEINEKEYEQLKESLIAGKD